MKRILEGVRVIEWGIAHLVPAATSTLGQMGADVIKIESRAGGDPHRGVKKVSGGISVEAPHGLNYYFEGLNHSKRSITIDLKKQEGREIVYRLVKKSDAFVTSFRREAIANCGMGYDILRQHNSRLVYGHASAYGPKGIDGDAPGFDYSGQARAGLLTLMKSPEEVPFSPFGIGDQVGSITIAFGILSGLLAVERLGIGQEMEFSLLGSSLWLALTPFIIKLMAGNDMKPIKREEAPNPLYNLYKAGDGKWICLSHGYWGSRLWGVFCEAMGIQELENHPRYDTHDKRLQNGKELIPILDKIFLTKSREEWLQIGREKGLVFQPVNTFNDLLTDEQVLKNGYITSLHHPVLGDIKVPGFPIQYSETPCGPTRPAPELGQDTEDILTEIGGYTWNDIEKLRDQEVI